jgi:hypothetical protein
MNFKKDQDLKIIKFHSQFFMNIIDKNHPKYDEIIM